MIKRACWASHGARRKLLSAGDPEGLQLCDLEGAPVSCGARWRRAHTHARTRMHTHTPFCKTMWKKGPE